MLKRTFHIPNNAPAEHDVLLWELSQHHVGLSWADAVTKKLKGVSLYELRNLLDPEKLREIIETEATVAGRETRAVISSAGKNVLLMPMSQFTETSAKQLFEASFTTNDEAFFFDELPDYNVVVVHSLPYAFLQLLDPSQPASVRHQYTLLLYALNTGDSSAIHLHVSSKDFQIVAVKDGQLKLAQTFFYTTPADIIYYLLAVCQQQGMSQKDITLLLSGLINKDSALFNELYQYFSNIQFWSPSPKLELASEYPVHFFSSFYNLVSCAL